MNDCETLEPSAAAADPAVENPSAWRADSLTDGVLIVLALMVVQRSVGFLREILFCRWLEAEQLGLWKMAFGFLMLAGPLIVLSLPGTFGRYAEYYRKQGRLRTFLLQTTLACALLASTGTGLVLAFRVRLSEFIFGSPDHEPLLLLLAASLLVIVAYNYTLSLFTALRSVRLASSMEFVNGVMFAVLGVSLLAFWRCDTAAVILAYGGASLICVLGASYWYVAAWKTAPTAPGPTSKARGEDGIRSYSSVSSLRAEDASSGIWHKLLRLTAWILLINVLTNLFGYADNYLILHFAPGNHAACAAMVGQYHSARVVPLLLTSLAVMISGILLPHLSHDWESGQRDRVSFRLNLFLKLAIFGLFSVGTVVLAVAPLLFEVAFRGKYADGSAAMPGMLVAAVWFSAATIAQLYIWCEERTGLVGIALAAGLAVNVGLNLLLLPTLGLTSAVLAAVAANLVMLLSILFFNRLLGFSMQHGVWILLAAPASLCCGPWVAIGVLAAISFAALRSELIFNRFDKEKIAEKWEVYLSKLAVRRSYSSSGRTTSGS